MIRKALPSDLSSIYILVQSCAKAMIANGIYQWNEHYPTKERFQKDIELQELYVLEEDNAIKGVIVLTDFMDKEYIPITWLTNNENNLYIHRLAVHPDYWGKGYAQRLMDFGEDFAKNNAYQSVRLDTFSQNKRNQKFYEIRGYQRLGNIYFPKQSEHPFYCYELLT
ncbi:GNAT family N-acetyltransferase [Aquimarina muelleri]|uniref:N-acetyltransferase n=1 Tax=Aquimarina muelleri TaxID=279356 RepID=A0A918N1V8_9FLAO|nr:GNAT family N-acetyltransferase [Aquimarina muelleri]MCX2761681.1 GNAT family N-acetyltransferase [Aquimarina muelleri]GGX07153.1 N-acetyltransferase [Aquimarina muelleri]